MVNITHSPELSNMQWILSTSYLMPEILVGVSALILLLGGVFAGNTSASKMHGLSIFVLCSIVVLMAASPLPFERETLFSNLFVTDGFTKTVKYMLVTSAILVFMISSEWVRQETQQKPEFTVLMLFALLGMLLMVSANDFMALYLGMELSSLALYVLAAFNRDSLLSTESGIKYFVLGSLASGLYLFGASLIYGFSGSTSFGQMHHALVSLHPVSPGLLTGLVLVCIAFCFKISAAPFHMWTPDVYEGAPTPVTAFFSTAPKIAAVAVLLRLLHQPFHGMAMEWRQILVVASIASMLVGAFGALAQTNIKRMLAYSSIGHVGYSLAGMASVSSDGVASVILYFTLYLFMSIGSFACILLMQRDGKAVESISDLAGFSRQRPFIAAALSIFMFSMAGIPPLAGFFGKMYVLLAALKSGLVGLAVIGVLSSVVACFYYLKIIKVMYFDEPNKALDCPAPKLTLAAMAICSMVTLMFFLVPTPILQFTRAAAEALIH